MPQFDTYSYLIQITTLTITFWSLYFLSLKFLIFSMLKTLKLRSIFNYTN